MESKILIIFSNEPYSDAEINNINTKEEPNINYIDYNYVKKNKDILTQYEIVVDATTVSKIFKAFSVTVEYNSDLAIQNSGITMLRFGNHKIVKIERLENFFIPIAKSKYITEGRKEEIDKLIKLFFTKINLISNLLSVKQKVVFKKTAYETGIELNDLTSNKNSESKFILVRDRNLKTDTDKIKYITINELSGIQKLESLIKKII